MRAEVRAVAAMAIVRAVAARAKTEAAALRMGVATAAPPAARADARALRASPLVRMLQ